MDFQKLMFTYCVSFMRVSVTLTFSFHVVMKVWCGVSIMFEITIQIHENAYRKAINR